MRGLVSTNKSLSKRIIYYFNVAVLCILLTACSEKVGSNDSGKRDTNNNIVTSINTSNDKEIDSDITTGGDNTASEKLDINNIPSYSGSTYCEVNNNIPTFTKDEITTNSYEYYGDLDELGRCTACMACVGKDIMPTEKRGDISSVHPTGWHSVRYDNVDGGSLYNRSHLIGYQLTGENANVNNLITGTRYMNAEGMVPFENMVADYVKETNNHVMYRVTPIFEGDNLVASGVQMEAYSVEDNGDGVCYNVYCYNVQPGVVIDYATGDSHLENQSTELTNQKMNYILNTYRKKFHTENCASAAEMNEKNKQTYYGTRDEVIEMGYEPCGNCHP